MRIGELARRTGLSRDTIRFYEKHDLIRSEPSQSASNDYRDYPEVLVERLDMIIAARDAGMKVSDLQIFLRYLERGEAGDSFDVEQFMDEKIEDLIQTIQQAERFLSILKQTKAALTRGPVEWNE